MSYSIDANLLIYAVNRDSSEHAKAVSFMESRPDDDDLLCLTWPALMAFQRIATHPGVFDNPLKPDDAWKNIMGLLALPRARVIGEQDNFAEDYSKLSREHHIRGNLVPDAHIATILKQNGVKRIYTADTDFRKFDFLKVVNPLL